MTNTSSSQPAPVVVSASTAAGRAQQAACIGAANRVAFDTLVESLSHNPA